MHCIRKFLLRLGAAILLLFSWGRLVSAQGICSVSSSPVQVRWEATVEALGTISLTCTGVPAVSSSIAVRINAPLVEVSGTPDNLTTFPAARLTSSVGLPGTPVVTSIGNTVTFSFTPLAAGSQTFTISGIRANVAASGLPFGSAVRATLSTSTLSLTNASLIVGFISAGLGPGSGFPDTPCNLIACPAAIPAAEGPPTTAINNPAPSPVAGNSLRLVFVEGFSTAFARAAREDGGAGLQGTRLLARLTGIPSEIVPYAPRFLRTTSSPTAGEISPSTSTLALQRVSDPNPDGSGGEVLPGVLNQFDKIPVNGGTATLVYEVTSDSATTLDTVTLFITLSATANPGAVTIHGEISLAPVGPPTVAPARPQFTASTAMILSKQALNFVQYIGSSPPVQTVSLLNTGTGMLDWTVTSNTSLGGDWLAVSPDHGTDNGSFSVSISDMSLPAGTYLGEIEVSDAHAVNSPQTIPVSVTVTTRPTFTVTPEQFSFQAAPGTSPPAEQLRIRSSGRTIPWTATVQTSSGGNWLSISPLSGVTGTLTNVAADSAGLASGAYQGSITISAPDSVNVSETISVSLLVGAPTTIVSGATFQTGAGLTRGMIAVAFGSNLADIEAVPPPGTLPTLLRNTQVLVNGVAAPLFYVSPTQINFQVPLEVSGSEAQVAIASNGILGRPTIVGLAEAAPGIFTIADTGNGAVLNEDSTLNSDGNPALAGSVIQIFATGLGAVTPQVPAGQLAPISPLSKTITMPVVLIGGIAAEVTYSGLAPGTIGVNQINARIPGGVQSGSSITLQIQIGAAISNVATIAVQ